MLKHLANRERRFNLIVTIALFLLSLVFILPLYWTAVFATRTLSEVFQFPPPLWFGGSLLDNYARIEQVFPPFRPIINSLIVAVPKTIGLVLVSALAGYGFARSVRAPGRGFLLATTFVLVNVVVDILYTYLDPRIRLR